MSVPEMEMAKELAKKERSKLLIKKRYRQDLTPEEEIFCREYLQTGNATKSVIAAGYQGRNAATVGSRWFNRPRIQKKLERLRTRDEAQADLTRELYLDMLKDTYQRAMGDGDYSGANRAMELIGKALGYLVDQKAVLSVSKKIDPEHASAEAKRLAKIAGVTLGD